MIPWNDLLLLLEGQPVRFPTPQNHMAKDVLLTSEISIAEVVKGK